MRFLRLEGSNLGEQCSLAHSGKGSSPRGRKVGEANRFPRRPNGSLRLSARLLRDRKSIHSCKWRIESYQVLIIEDLPRQGVETVFLKAPSTETPEDHLLVQFQGMIAEYERAQILERSRRGKRHRARRGDIAVLSGAPYGYRYHKKTQDSDAFYEIVEPQASVVRDVYRHYTEDHMTIGAIARKLNERGVPTSSGRSRWERSVVWAILRNPAYKGRACFGKTRLARRSPRRGSPPDGTQPSPPSGAV